MNPDSPRPPREAIEVRLTALLLGEAPAEEAAALRELIAKDAPLAELHERLKRSIDLVREAAATPTEPATAPATPLKLSDERRQRLLAHFKTVAPKEFVPRPRRREWSWVVPLSAAAAVIMLLAAITIPNFTRARESTSVNSVLNNLRILEGAKDQWALEHKNSSTDVLTLEDIKGYLKGGVVRPVQGEQYNVGRVADPVTAEVDADRAKKTFGGITAKQPAQATRGQRARLNAEGELTFVDKNGKAAVASPYGNVASDPVVISSSSAPQEEKLVAAKPSAPSFQDGSAPVKAFKGAAFQQSLPPSQQTRREVESLEVRHAGDTPRQQIVLPPIDAQDDWAKAQLEAPRNQGERGFPLGSLLAQSAAGGRGGVWGGGGGGGIGGGGSAGFGPAADAQPDSNARNAWLFGNPQSIGIVERPAPGSVGSTNRFIFALDAPPAAGDFTTFGLQPRQPAGPNQPPVNSEAKFAASSPADNKALGFAWNIRELEREQRMGLGVQGGTAPSSSDPRSKARPDIRDADADIKLDALLSLSTGNGRALQEKRVEAGVAGTAATPIPGGFSPDGAVDLNRLDRSGQVAQKPDGIDDRYAYQVPRLGDKPELGTWYQAKPELYDAEGKPRSKVESLPQITAKALSNWSEVSSGVSQKADRNGRVDQNVARLGEPAIPLGVETTLSFTNMGKYIIQNAATSEEGVRRQSPSIVLPSVTPDTTAGIPSVVTGSLTPENAASKSKPSVSEPSVQASTLEPETLRRLQAAREEAEKDYSVRQRQLKELKNLPEKQLREVLSKRASDATLSNLTSQLTLAEKHLASKSAAYGPSNSEIDRWQAQVQELTKKIDDRINGVMAGLETQAEAAKATVNSLSQATEAAESAKKQETDLTRRDGTYLDAKRELDNQQKLRDAVALRIQQETAEASLPRQSAVEIVDPAEARPTKSPKLSERLWGAVTGKEKSTARISIEKEVSDIAPLGLSQNQTKIDPSFIPAELEKIRSKAVLDKVIDKLNLSEVWAKKDAQGQKLTRERTAEILKNSIEVRREGNTSLIDITVKSDKSEEAARIASAIAEVYRDSRLATSQEQAMAGVQALKEKLAEQDTKVAQAKQRLERLQRETTSEQADANPPKVTGPAPIPQPEVQTRDNAFSTFSLNVSDVSFKLAAASLEKGVMPEPATVRSEEFINAFDYRDPEPPPGVPIAFAWERTRYPFAHNRDLLRFSVKTAAAGRQPGRPLNLVLLLDNSGSMERADRVQIIHEALRVLATQLQPQDKFSVVAFARTARLWVDGVGGNEAGAVAEQISSLTPQGGTNLGDAMDLAYQTALRHYLANGGNRIVLLTDGAANLGNVDPDALKQKVEAHRKQGIALDCFGIGWEGYNDDLLEILSRNGDGRYGFINTPEEAASDFAGQLAGALRVAASDVKVQVEFNPARVTAYRQIGYAKHQLTKEQFRDNTVDAAEIGAAEAGNALYAAEVNARGEGPLAIVRVRYKVPGTADYREHEWAVPYTGNAVSLEQASPAMRLAATASAFSEWLVSSPYAAEVTPDRLLGHLGGVPEIYGADARPKKLEWMIRQAKSISGK